MTSPIGDMLTRIKNASLAKHQSLGLPHSSLKGDLARLLVKEGYLEKVAVQEGGPKKKILKVDLKYSGKKSAISGVKQISKPGLRIYASAREISRLGGRKFSLVILSTSQGLMTAQQAKKKNLGGEILAEVW